MKLFGKSVLIVLAAVMCVLGVLNFSAFASGMDNDVIDDWDIEYIPGDLDGNSLVNADDLVLMRKYVAGLVSENDFVFVAADINNDENVNADDIVYIRKVIAGLI
ncbi:MAG: dockerin type I repeat-containing protein [Clostridia bacterium]|nr:dockerin type I repeat-containing protein [Clostridia bacterium]